MTAARAWFAARSLRERRLILAMLALAAVTLVWGGIIRPVREGLSSGRARYADAVVRLGEAEARLAAVRRAARRSPSTLGAPLADAVRARADAAGLTLASLDAEAPDRVRITIATTRAGALMAWLAALENDGILVDQVAITPTGAGSVAVTATMKAGAR